MLSSRLISTLEAARHIGVTPRTVARLVKRGDLEAAHRLPGKTGAYLFTREEVEHCRAMRELQTAGKAAK